MNLLEINTDNICKLNKEEILLAKTETQRVKSLFDDLIKIGSPFLGAVNILEKAGYHYNLCLDSENPFYVEILFTIILNKLQSMQVFTDENDLIVKIVK